MKTGLESLDTGAPEITYSGNQGPKSPQEDQRMMQEFQMAQLEEEYQKYVFEMEEQGIEPMSMQQFLEQIAAEAQMSSNEKGIGNMAMKSGLIDEYRNYKMGQEEAGEQFMSPRDYYRSLEQDRMGAAFGGIMGLDGRRAYVGGSYSGQDPKGGDQGAGQYQGGSGAPGSAESKGMGGDGPSYVSGDLPPGAYKKGQEEFKKTYAIPDEPKQKITVPSPFTLAMKTMKKIKAFNNQKQRQKFISSLTDEEREVLEGQLGEGYLTDETGESLLNPSNLDILNQFGYQKYLDRFKQTETSGDGGGQEFRQQTIPFIPDEEEEDTTPPIIPTDPVTGQYSNQYLIPGASNFYSNLPSNMLDPTTNMITLANGGRANYAGGGIADLRQGYFLGKIVKKITKPFKKAFKGFKKIAKSPLGKMALMYFGGNLLQGNPLFGNPLKGNITSMLTKGGGGGGFEGITEGFRNIAESAFKPENAFRTITGLSGLAGLYTMMANKNMPDPYADYERRLNEERENFAPIPTDFVQFSANGGRIGFAEGGDDDDDDENFRSKALGALYSMKRPQFSMGGNAGMPPITLQLDGQNIKSFSDDESTGMANTTTMPNQMPRPMMDPMMQRQMMAQRGMMQQPRIMAQEGGMMDMGGMEKDYRNEGGFVPIGGQERADDVPARLSKNEFVFTADAVRNAGGGDIDKGAEIMENMMENLEQGGKVSKASQGLSGAREMFATQQRLEEVL